MTITRFVAAVILSYLGLFFISYNKAYSLANVYPEDVVNNFVNDCTTVAAQEGVDPQIARNICTCYLQGIQNQYTYEEFVAIDRQVANGQPLPPEFETIVKNCVGQNIQPQE